MGEKLVVGPPINKGLRNDREPFVIDNDSFPTLVNAYQWRGRVKRKRGTSLLGRLNRYFSSTYFTGSAPITFDGAGNANLFAFSTFPADPDASIVLGSVTIVGSVGPVTYTDPTMDGFLTPTGTGGPNTIDYSTGAILIPAQAGGTATAIFNYYPALPVMGIEELILSANEFPGTLAFDTTYAYNILTTAPYNIYDVSYYKNPPSSTVNASPYTAKTIWTPVTWHGDDSLQFWSSNFQQGFFVTNNNPGMQSQLITTVTFVSATVLTIVVPANANVVVGDWVWINEVVGAGNQTINQQTGFVTAVAGATTLTVSFPYANISAGAYTGGVLQYLTNTVPGSTGDGIRWYDGDPNPNMTLPSTPFGWANFAPPLSLGPFSIDSNATAQYYLVGAVMIYPYRDFFLFFGPYIQTSAQAAAGAAPIYLQDTVIFSQNGTPYYTASFNNNVTPPYGPTINYVPLLTPGWQSDAIRGRSTAVPFAFWEDVTGFGGYISSGVAQPILTLVPNEDMLILGYPKAFTRLIYTGNNLIPFLFYRINTELGSASTFSSVVFDQGSFSLGNFGIVLATQVSASRIDLEIPDQAFQVSYITEGAARVCAARDYVNEWVYLTYPANSVPWKFPNQTLMYNYRDVTWSILNECYTTYGTFRRSTGNTWASNRTRILSWNAWNEPWNAGLSTLLMPEVLAGNQQGFILIRDTSTNEGVSGYIQAIDSATNVITSPNHCLNGGDYIVISGATGTIAPLINGNIYSITQLSPPNPNQFALNPPVPTGTYTGGAVFQRLYVPFIQTKQFPTAWSLGRKTQIGVQMYLFTRTQSGQITLNMYLSQDGSNFYNNPQNNGSVVYSQTLFTSPQFPINTVINAPLGLLGNGILTTITINPLMTFQIEGVLVPGATVVTIGALATFTDDGRGGLVATGTGLTAGSSINYTTGVIIMVFLIPPAPTASIINTKYYYGNVQQSTNSTQAQIWQRMNTSLVGDTVQFGFTLNDAQMRDPTINNQFAEIEFHGAVLDVSPSALLT